MSELVLDVTRSHVRIHTFAEGLFARLAHDLELVCGELSGTATSEPGGGRAALEAPLRGLGVAGVVGRGGRLDERGLSPSERRDCVAKMREDVFHAGLDDVIRIEVHLQGGSARVRIVPPNGRAVESVVKVTVREESAGGVTAMRAAGTFSLSLAAIGSEVVKGPMNAFRVKDNVELTFDVVFVPALAPGTQPA